VAAFHSNGNNTLLHNGINEKLNPIFPGSTRIVYLPKLLKLGAATWTDFPDDQRKGVLSLTRCGSRGRGAKKPILMSNSKGVSIGDTVDLMIGDTLESPGEHSFGIIVPKGGFNQHTGSGRSLSSTFQVQPLDFFGQNGACAMTDKELVLFWYRAVARCRDGLLLKVCTDFSTMKHVAATKCSRGIP